VGYERNIVESAVGSGRFACKVKVIDWSHLDEPESLLTWSFPGPDRRYNWGSARVPMARVKDLRAGAIAAWDELRRASAVAGEFEVQTTFDSNGYRFGMTTGPRPCLQPLTGSTHVRHIAIRSESDLGAFTAALKEAEDVLPTLLRMI